MTSPDTQAAPPWKYKPSAWRERVPIAILAGIATVISVYLALYQWRLIDSVWDPVVGDGSRRVLARTATSTAAAARRRMRCTRPSARPEYPRCPSSAPEPP